MRPEAPVTLLEPPPRALGLLDQFGLWTNLGVSLLLPVAAGFVLMPVPGGPALSLVAALTAVVLGTVVGCVALGLAAAPGAATGAPAMVVLRGLLGRRASYLPTALNLLQCLGWATFEIVIIAETAARLTDESLRPTFVVGAGVLATAMALRPLGVVRSLRRYAVWLVLLSTAYLLVQVLRQPLPPLGEGSWTGFWQATDVVIALPVSWVPLAADYARHSRSSSAAFGGALLGYGSASLAMFSLGVLAIAAYGLQPGFDVLDALIAVPVGVVALLILVADELDEAFANLYSTAVSAQNLRPGLDRRPLAVAVGVVAVVLALLFDVVAYEGFLFLLGSVFVPLFATFAVDYYLLSRLDEGRWDVSAVAPARWLMLLPWAAGFVTYQLVNPGIVGGWVSFWTGIRNVVGFEPASWMSASILSFTVAALAAAVVGLLDRRIRRSGSSTPALLGE